MSKPIFEIVDQLPNSNMTTFVLRSLDWVVPGQWDNLVGFENTIKTVTGETDQDLIQQIGDRAIYLYNDKNEGYQRALWLFQTIDTADYALGAAALANKVGEQISFLKFLTNVTPKSNQAQTIDLSLKLVTELVSFCLINGIPGDSIGDFISALADYGGESIMRMAALVCIDGLIPLGPDFINSAADTISRLSPSDIESNPGFSKIKDLIPGGNTSSQIGFIRDSFNSVSGWMSNFVSDRGLTVENVVSNMKKFVEISDDRLDYLGAFLDMSTNYYEHTGTQTIARRLIERAVAEI